MNRIASPDCRIAIEWPAISSSETDVINKIRLRYHKTRTISCSFCLSASFIRHWGIIASWAYLLRAMSYVSLKREMRKRVRSLRLRSARVLRDEMRFFCAVLREWCISDGIAIHVVHKTAYRSCPRYRTVSTQKSKVARAPFDVRFRANLAGRKFKSSLRVNVRRSIDVQSRSRGRL